MANILITGGLGFIGYHLVSSMEKDHNIIILDNETTYGLPLTQSNEINYLINLRKTGIKRSKLYKADITDSYYLNWLFSAYKIDTVIHLASLPRDKIVNYNPILGAKTIIEGTLNLCEVAKNHKVKKFIYVSSSMVYGNFTDDTKETQQCNPIGKYGILKLTGENLVKDYASRGYFDYVIIRPSAVYGPFDMEDRLVAKFIFSAMHGTDLEVNGEQESLDFTYVTDLANGIAKASLSNNTNNKTYNITRGKSRTILDAAQLVISIVGKGNIVINNKDQLFPTRGSLNIDAARLDFGYEPKINIEYGLELYYNWILENYWKFNVE